jgi:cystathionine gamma-lyase
VTERRYGPGTRAVHAGLPERTQGAPFLPGPAFASAYHLAGDADDAPWGGYQRYGNPTWAAYEQAVGELEGGEAVLFSSGMAAVTAVLLPVGRPGAVVVPRDGYPGARTLAADELAPRGVETRLVAGDEQAIREALPGASLVLIETPANPRLEVVDIAALARAAHEHGALLAVDNTLATPLGQRPLELGADLSVTSASKSMTGHSDLLMGYVVTRDEDVLVALRRWRGLTGAIAGPQEAWLAHRSLATLDLRLERSCANAQALAELFERRPDVVEVRYPGLPSHEAHAVAARQMRRFGPVVSFTLADADAAQRFLAACELVFEATSFGGLHTTAERRGRWGTDDVAEGLIRLSAGCEDPEDLLADVSGALDAL